MDLGLYWLDPAGRVSHWHFLNPLQMGKREGREFLGWVQEKLVPR